MDFLTKLPEKEGQNTLLIVVDRFSKILVIIPLGDDTDAESVARAFFTNLVQIHGLPRQIISDWDLWFVGNAWTKLMATMGTSLLFSTAYYPQMDEQSERAICSIL